MKQIKEAKIIKAIHASRGNISNAAKRLGVSRMTVYERLKKDEKLRMELQHAREELCDLAENVLVEHLEKGNLKAAIYVLGRVDTMVLFCSSYFRIVRG